MRLSFSFLLLTLLLSLYCSVVICQEEEPICDENDHVCLANAAQEYMDETIVDETILTEQEVVAPKGANPEGKPREAVKECVDRYPEHCPAYVAQGECEKNPGYVNLFVSSIKPFVTLIIMF